jgi:hypothetical protein
MSGVILGMALGIGAARLYASQVSLKKDWQTGETLEAQPLNENFRSIEDALNGLDKALQQQNQTTLDGFFASLSAYCQAAGTPQARMVAVVGADGNEALTGTTVCQTLVPDVVTSGYAFYSGYQNKCMSGGWFYNTRGSALRAAPVLVPFADCDASPAPRSWARPGREGMFFCCY